MQDIEEEKIEYTILCHTCENQKTCPYMDDHMHKSSRCPFYKDMNIETAKIEHMGIGPLEENRDNLARAIDELLLNQSTKMLEELKARPGNLDPYMITKLKMELINLKNMEMMNDKDVKISEKIKIVRELNKGIDQLIMLEGLSKETAGKNDMQKFFKSIGITEEVVLKVNGDNSKRKKLKEKILIEGEVEDAS